MIASGEITEHMEVLGSDGAHVGTVDHMHGNDYIKLTKSDAPDGEHHFIPLAWVDRVDSQVHLTVTAEDAMDAWEHESEVELTSEDDGPGRASEDADAMVGNRR
jgi:hypothetical protein